MRFIFSAILIFFPFFTTSFSQNISPYTTKTLIISTFNSTSKETLSLLNDSIKISLKNVNPEYINQYFNKLNSSSNTGSVLISHSEKKEDINKFNTPDPLIVDIINSSKLPKDIINLYLSNINNFNPFENAIDIKSSQLTIKDYSRDISFLTGYQNNPFILLSTIDNSIRLEVFLINILNNSNHEIEFNPDDYFLFDDTGLQQNPININFFSENYKNYPSQLANVQRTLMQKSPIFPNTNRTGFLVFYAVPNHAKQIIIRKRDKNQINSLQWSWSFSSVVNEEKYLNLFVRANKKGKGKPLSNILFSIFIDNNKSYNIFSNDKGWVYFQLPEDENITFFKMSILGAKSHEQRPDMQITEILYGSFLIFKHDIIKNKNVLELTDLKTFEYSPP